jgi:transposase, IS5 family
MPAIRGKRGAPDLSRIASRGVGFWGICISDTADFYRARLNGMVDSQHPLVVLSTRLLWAAIEQALAPNFQRKVRPGVTVSAPDLPGAYEVEFGSGTSPAGRPRLQIRLMSSLQYLMNAFNLSDEELVECWSHHLQSSRGRAVL